MEKKHFLLPVLALLLSMSAMAKDFYEFDNVQAKAILNVFLKAKQEGRVYPTEQQFQEIGISAADIEFIRSHVKRNEIINTDDRLNTSLYKDRKVFMCIPMGNGAQGSHGYPSNDMTKTDVYSMWNYTSAFGSWNHGFFQAPGCWIDAAHKNGSRIMSGQMFFESKFGGADDKEWVELISTKDANGYVYVEPMINALMYFGHDGIVYNWEAFRYKEADVVAFHKALYKEARKRGFLDYNSLIYTNDSELRQSNYQYLYGTKDEPIHEVFLNYSGGNIQRGLGESLKLAEQTCGETDRLYAGVYINTMSRNWNELAKTDVHKLNLIVWGEHTANRIYSNTKGEGLEWQKNYQLMQEHFFSGGNSNPADRPSSANANSAQWDNSLTDFCGLAEYMPERSAIAKPFLTHFNLGNGKTYYFHGAPQTEGGWYNMASQDIVPTYRWLVYNAGTQEANKTLKPTFTHEEAYVGGTCLSLKGDAGTSGADVVLYKTNIALGAQPFAHIAAKKLSGDATLSLIVRVNGQWQEYPVEGLTNNWTEKNIILDKVGTGTIERIGLRVKGNADLHVGKLELNDANKVDPKPIKEFVSAETVSEGHTDITLKLYWTVDGEVDEYGRSYNADNHIDHFEIFVKKDGKEVEVGRTTQWATIASHIPFSPDAQTLEIGVRAVSTDLKTASPIVWRTVQKGEPDEVIDKNDTSQNGEYYKVRYNKKTPHQREDRYMMHVGFKDANGKLQQYPDNDLTARITKQFYLDITNKAVFDVEAGKTYTPYISYHGLWMSGYVYADWNNDGEFNFTDGITFNNNVPTRTDRCEIISFSAHNADKGDWVWYNSNGKRFNKTTDFPKDDNIKNWLGSFKVPEDLQPGVYRVRFKLDWNELDPAGDKEILQNGGDIIDALINVHQPTVAVGAKPENGKVMKGSTVLTETMNETSPFETAFDVTLSPNAGYKVTGATIRYGYNLDNESGLDAYGNPQWRTEKVEFTTENYTVPANLVKANVLIIPTFEVISGVEKVIVTEELIENSDVYNLNGQLVKRAGSNRTLPAGVYVVKGSKFIVK